MPEYACTGDLFCLQASGADQEPGGYQWSVTEGASFIGPSSGEQVIIRIDAGGEIWVVCTRGDCAGGGSIVALGIDLDVDSDNNNGFGFPDHSDEEDEVEDDPGVPGKLFAVNNGNTDYDSVPDFADGFNLDGQGGNDDDACDGEGFVPVVIKLPDGVDHSAMTITLSYSASDPGGVTVDGSRYEAAPGHLRLWKKPGDVARSANSIDAPVAPGDYVPPGEYSAQSLGISAGSINLFAEGMSIEEGVSLPISITLEVTGEAQFPACMPEDTVRVRLFDIQHLTVDEETLISEAAPSVAGPSELAPDLSINLVATRLTPGGAIEVDLVGHVSDRLSELAENPLQRVQEVQFYVNGAYNGSISNLPAWSPGSGIMPWQPYRLDVNFVATVVIDAGVGFVRPGGYVIEAYTSPNAAGRRANDKLLISVQWQAIDELFQAPVDASLGLTVFFAAVPNDSQVDGGWVYFGDREVEPTDGIVLESAVDSLEFVGSLLLEDDGVTVDVPCTVLVESADFTQTAADSFDATVTYFFPDGLTYTTTGTWLETDVHSLRFIQTTPVIPNGATIGNSEDGFMHFVPVVAFQEDFNLLPEGRHDSMERTLVRVIGLGESVDPGLLTGMVNGIDTPTDVFTYSPPYYYLVCEDQTGRPRIFVVSNDDLPAGIDSVVPDNLVISDAPNDLKYRIAVYGHESVDGVNIELFEDDFGTGATPGVSFEGPVTNDVLLTYYQLLYGDTGLELLGMFLDAGGAIELDDVGGDLDVHYWLANAGIMDIEIEEDVHPVTAASYLWAGLQKTLHLPPMQGQMDPEQDYDWWVQAMQQRAAAAAEVTAAAAQLYIAGITIISEGADWALTIHELTQGHWEAAIGFIPFVPAAIGTSGRVLLRNAAGEVVAEFDHAMMVGIRNAKAQSSFAARWQALSQLNLPHEVRLVLLKSRFIEPPNSPLGKNLIDAGILPPTHFMKPEAHHRIPQTDEFRGYCAFVGIDVDQAVVDGVELGRWVEGGKHGPHQTWSSSHLQGWQAWFEQRIDTEGAWTWTKEEVLNAILALDNYPASGPW